MQSNAVHHHQLVQLVYPMSQPTIWIRAFDFYFLGLNLLVLLIQAFFMIAILKFDVLFTILFCIFWCICPLYNFLFLLSSETYKYNLLLSNYWVMWFVGICQLGLILISWQLFVGDFAQYLGLPLSPATVTIAILLQFCYFTNAVLFVLYGYFLSKDMQLRG
ncbi:UNKNOWN [Stylonychia lemnae]|uniref:Transmembrane protein n=1 Tax=Stylonychia lemnae TaxID=5949 RepID=A0A078ALU3_STYLE|nr:UNKNOWN [Stylonychia lemnae]|eukprot:CDW83194.1 UNKNOWN [Stylonychia lemnae]